jgi:hypothetical protein
LQNGKIESDAEQATEGARREWRVAETGAAREEEDQAAGNDAPL